MMQTSRTIAAVVLALLAGTTRADEVHDIKCSGDQATYAQPGECSPKCPVRLGRSFGCALAPRCPAWDSSDANLRVFYNAAVFNRGVVASPQLTLIAHIVNKYYSPFKANELAISIVPERKTSWGLLSFDPSKEAKLPLEIAADTFLTSPANLAHTIGHELIHAEQIRRAYPAPPTNFESAANAIWELEASSWELDKDAFLHRIGANKFLGCLTPEEKKASELLLKCTEWAAKKAVHNVLTSPRKNIYGPKLSQWIAADPWAKTWFAAQTDPAADPGDKPDFCK